MLADQMEAAARGLDDPDPDLVRRVVDHFLNRAVVDGSLADCELSLRDLEVCRDAFRQGLDDLSGRPPGETDTEIPAPRKVPPPGAS